MRVLGIALLWIALCAFVVYLEGREREWWRRFRRGDDLGDVDDKVIRRLERQFRDNRGTHWRA